MIMEMAAISLTVKAIVGIVCGSVAGGILAGGVATYYITKNFCLSRSRAQNEYDEINTEAVQISRQQQRHLNSANRAVAHHTQVMMSEFRGEQVRGSTILAHLEGSVEAAKQHQTTGLQLITDSQRDNETIKQLMTELKLKTEALDKVNDEFKEVKEQLQLNVAKLVEAVNEVELLKKIILDKSGEKNYTATLLETMKRMSASHGSLESKVVELTKNYKQAESEIEEKTLLLNQALKTIKQQENNISELNKKVGMQEDEKRENKQYTPGLFPSK